MKTQVYCAHKSLQQQTKLAIQNRKNKGNIEHPAYGYLAWVDKVNVRTLLIHNLTTKLYKSPGKSGRKSQLATSFSCNGCTQFKRPFKITHNQVLLVPSVFSQMFILQRFSSFYFIINLPWNLYFRKFSENLFAE